MPPINNEKIGNGKRSSRGEEGIEHLKRKHESERSKHQHEGGSIALAFARLYGRYIVYWDLISLESIHIFISLGVVSSYIEGRGVLVDF